MSKKSKKPLHHGECSEEFEVGYVGTDYFIFWHKPCREKMVGHCGHSLPKYLIIDEDGRVIFHLKCQDCGFEDALKTSLEMWTPQEEREKSYERMIIIEDTLFKKLKGTKAWWAK